MNNIVFDNIIFSLQQAGGVSGVWKELIQRVPQKNNGNCSFLEYKNAETNFYRKELTINEAVSVIKKETNLQIERFLSPNILFDKEFIFHSSYYRICKNKKAKNVTTVHDFIYEYYRSGLPKLIHCQQKKHAVLSSDAIICVSQNTKEDLLKFFPSVKEEQVFVVYNGVSDDFNKLEIKEKPDFIQSLGTYLLYIGNREQPHKNFGPVVDALQQFPEINLVLIGGGGLKQIEINLFDKKIANRYFHFSNIDNEKLNIFYNYAFSLIYPSHYEGFGIPILEAQRAGCPVIAKRGSSITEVAGEAALMLNMGTPDEICQYINQLKQDDIRQDIIKKGYKNATNFSWDKMAEEVYKIYQSI